ncbi:hypothetical protein EAH_00021610 [Eimeria acervulina]|uniref:CCHC-type domain-containing protein n=1 Tax=Eimeria acervulina TaxID=5801 RepID=U6GMK8_EIMAC|nr:hypothetical protein EAH_00021610 [Eimeria acervulina]CDI81420.1 hypothetical protein EAH_00021610 [Eimeria acervulina]
MEPQGEQSEEIAELKRQIEWLQDCLYQMNEQRSATPAPSIPREMGNNMEPFLTLIERRFRKMGLPPELWGDELGKYIDEDALRCWTELQRSGTDMTDWSLVKQELIKDFCTVNRATLIYQMAANKWTGNCSAYSANFSRITARGIQLPAEDLVGYFLTNIPAELRWAVTQQGTIQFSNWRAASNALAAIAAPWGAAQDEFRRREREFQLSLAGRAAEFPRGPASTGIRRYTQASGDRTEMICFQCKGKGHTAKNCPTGDPKLRKPGETCRNCGGMSHYARECRTSGQKPIHKEQGAPVDDEGPPACRKLSAERRTAAQAPSGSREVALDTENSREVNDGASLEDSQSVTNVELPP